MAPRSMIEWIAGANIPRVDSKQRRRSRGPRTIVEVIVSTDEDTSDEEEECQACKRVHFEDERVLKSALKKKDEPPKENFSKVEVAEPPKEPAKPDPPKRQAKAKSENDNCVCDCKECNDKIARGKSTTTTTTSHADAKKNDTKPTCVPAKCKAGGKQQKGEQTKKQNSQTASKSNKPAKPNNAHKKENSEYSKQPVTSKTPTTANAPHTRSSSAYPAQNARTHAISAFARHNMSRLILPSRAEVLIREDVIESATDPRPNAFFDAKTGLLRVYHGPHYGNPMATLVPLANANVPIGTPAPYSSVGYAVPWSVSPPAMSGALPADWNGYAAGMQMPFGGGGWGYHGGHGRKQSGSVHGNENSSRGNDQGQGNTSGGWYDSKSCGNVSTSGGNSITNSPVWENSGNDTQPSNVSHKMPGGWNSSTDSTDNTSTPTWNNDQNGGSNWQAKNTTSSNNNKNFWQPDQNQTALSGGSWADGGVGPTTAGEGWGGASTTPAWGDKSLAASTKGKKGRHSRRNSSGGGGGGGATDNVAW